MKLYTSPVGDGVSIFLSSLPASHSFVQGTDRPGPQPSARDTWGAPPSCRAPATAAPGPVAAPDGLNLGKFIEKKIGGDGEVRKGIWLVDRRWKIMMRYDDDFFWICWVFLAGYRPQQNASLCIDKKYIEACWCIILKDVRHVEMLEQTWGLDDQWCLTVNW